MQKPIGQQRFKDIHKLDLRKKMYQQAKQKDPNLIVVVVQKDPKCKVFPNLKHNRFKIGKQNKFFEMYTAIRKRILDLGQKYESHSLFLYTKKVLPNKEMSIGEIWNSQKDPQDSLLYLEYAEMDPFGNFNNENNENILKQKQQD